MGVYPPFFNLINFQFNIKDIDMKKIFTLIITIVLPIIMIAQEEKPKFGVDFSGFIRNDIVLNSRQVISARGESGVLLAPAPIVEDRDGKDINGSPNFNMVGFTTRLRGKIHGPDAFGAKTSGLFEMDFIGYANSAGAVPFSLRLRHAMVKLQWEKAQLLTGQYWHPMWATECFPGTVSFGAGVPFNPLSRNPQIRFTYKLGKISLLGAAMSQGMFKSKAGAKASQNSTIPELHAQLQYKNDIISTGIGFNFQTLKPRQVTDSNYVTCQTATSTSLFGYIKVKLKPVTVKLYGMYGQSNDNMVMMGGFAVTDKTYTPEQVDKNFVEYTPYNTMSGWLDIETNGEKIKFGLFAGLSQNMGAKDSIFTSTYSGRWNNVNSMMRIAPRVKFISKKVSIGVELEYSAIDYAKENVDANGVIVEGADVGGIDKYGKVTNYETANNIKLLVSVAYKF